MQILNIKDQRVVFPLKEFESLVSSKLFYNDNNEEIFEVFYDSHGYPSLIKIEHDNTYDGDYLCSLPIEEIQIDGKFMYMIPFFQDLDLLSCKNVSICTSDNVLVCFDNRVNGIIISNIDIYPIEFLVHCRYRER